MALSPEQRGVLSTIVKVGNRMGATPKALKAAVEAGLVESSLRNLNYGDRDSLGVFQQRPSQGWGSPGQVRDVEHAARQFFARAIPQTGQHASSGELAQAVQRSAFPGRYQQRSGEASQLLRQYGVAATGGGGGRSTPGTAGTTTRTITTSPGVDNSDARRQALSQFLLSSGTDPTTGQQTGGDILSLALQMRQLKDIPARTATVRAAGAAPGRSGGASRATPGGGGSGAHAALSWAESKLNNPGARETGGENRGQLADFLNQRFGFGSRGAQPWCAMFTSAAVTKGGAPASARTASVAQVRQKAMQGVGYQRGYIPGRQARPGDLILFGNAHIGMVKSNTGGRITYVGGNQSDAVTTGQVPAQGASIVRPRYGARR